MVNVRYYKVEISRLTEDDGGGYMAHIPELDCYGDGDTAEEAIADVYEVAEDLIAIAMEDGKEIPTPMYFRDLDEFSGKLSIRLPKTLHKQVSQRAKAEDCSINQLINAYIAMGIGDAFGRNESILSKEVESFDHTVRVSSMSKRLWVQPKQKTYAFDGKCIAVANRGVIAYEK